MAMSLLTFLTFGFCVFAAGATTCAECTNMNQCVDNGKYPENPRCAYCVYPQGLNKGCYDEEYAKTLPSAWHCTYQQGILTAETCESRKSDTVCLTNGKCAWCKGSDDSLCVSESDAKTKVSSDYKCEFLNVSYA